MRTSNETSPTKQVSKQSHESKETPNGPVTSNGGLNGGVGNGVHGGLNGHAKTRELTANNGKTGGLTVNDGNSLMVAPRSVMPTTPTLMRAFNSRWW